MRLDTVIHGKFTVLDLIYAVAVLVIGLLVTRLTTVYLRRNLKTKLNKDKLDITIKSVYYLLITITLTWVLSTLGIKLSGLLVAGGFLGIIIGFASQSIVGNLVSGFFLTIERPMKIGNAVNIDGNIGIVEDINIISTKLRTWDGLDIRIPNEKVFTTSIINYVSNIARRFEYSLGIRHEDDAQQAVKIIREHLEKEPFVLKSPAPLIFVEKLDHSSVNITVKIWSPISEWYGLYMRLLWELKDVLEQNHIHIAFPQSVVHLKEKQEQK